MLRRAAVHPVVAACASLVFRKGDAINMAVIPGAGADLLEGGGSPKQNFAYRVAAAFEHDLALISVAGHFETLGGFG